MISTVYSGILIHLNPRWDNVSGQVRGMDGSVQGDVNSRFLRVLIDRHIFYFRGNVTIIDVTSMKMNYYFSYDLMTKSSAWYL